jgi:hypothetical protein
MKSMWPFDVDPYKPPAGHTNDGQSIPFHTPAHASSRQTKVTDIGNVIGHTLDMPGAKRRDVYVNIQTSDGEHVQEFVGPFNDHHPASVKILCKANILDLRKMGKSVKIKMI